MTLSPMMKGEHFLDVYLLDFLHSLKVELMYPGLQHRLAYNTSYLTNLHFHSDT